MTLIVDVKPAVNLRSGYVVQSTQPNFSVDATPSHPIADAPTLIDVGYYEVDVFDPVGTTIRRYPICIVDPTTLGVRANVPDSDEPAIFARLATELADAYPHGRVLPSSVGRSFGMWVQTSDAASLEIRTRNFNGSYSKIGEALARGPGTWRSGSFALPKGTSDLKIAVVFADQNLVLA